MGFGSDFLMIIGILPMPRPQLISQEFKPEVDDVTYLYLDEMPKYDSQTRNFLNLLKLNGQEVSINDRKKGELKGILDYSLFSNNYTLKTFDDAVQLKVRNLEDVKYN